jgi:hypothetical protein
VRILGAIGPIIRTFMVSEIGMDVDVPRVGCNINSESSLAVISIIIAVRNPSLIAASVSASDLVRPSLRAQHSQYLWGRG